MSVTTNAATGRRVRSAKPAPSPAAETVSAAQVDTLSDPIFSPAHDSSWPHIEPQRRAQLVVLDVSMQLVGLTDALHMVLSVPCDRERALTALQRALRAEARRLARAVPLLPAFPFGQHMDD